MHRLALAVVFLFAAVVAVTVPALNAQQNVLKDPQAVSLINSCLQASGGSNAVASVQDFVASGNATFHWDTPTQATVTVKGRVSANQFRTDATLSSGTRSWAVTNGAGVLLDTDQSRNDFTYQTAFSLRSLSWPVTDFITALSDRNASISYAGLVSTDQGVQAYQVHIQETYAAGSDPSGALTNGSARDYFIDPKTSLLLEIKNSQSFGTPPQSYSEEVVFSSYTSVNGLAIPFSVTEWVSGQQTWTIQINTVNFNVGLSDTDFQL